MGRVREAGRGGSKLRRRGESRRSRWSVASMGSGRVAEEWSGARRSCTAVKRESSGEEGVGRGGRTVAVGEVVGLRHGWCVVQEVVAGHYVEKKRRNTKP